MKILTVLLVFAVTIFQAVDHSECSDSTPSDDQGYVNPKPDPEPEDNEETPIPWWTDISADVEEVRSRYELPALGGAHIQGGVITQLGTSGLRSANSTKEVTDWDKWHLGYCTKAMTATLIATYVDEGALTWNTTLGELLPSVDMHEDYQMVTVTMLLSHYGVTLGNTYQYLIALDGDVVELRQKVVNYVLTEAPEVKPGTEFHYSNVGYIILGAALENITGQTWEQQMQERIFTPLNMSSCGFGAQDPNGTLQHPWGHNREGIPINPDNDTANLPPVFGPAGTVHCNLPDWANFIIESLKIYRGESTLLSLEQSQHIFKIVGNNYAAGWNVVERDWAAGEAFMHLGGNGINYAVIWGGPGIDQAFLAVTNILSNKAADALDILVDGMLQKSSLVA